MILSLLLCVKDTTCGKEPGCNLQSSMSNAVYMTSMWGGAGSWNNSPNITYTNIQHYTSKQTLVNLLVHYKTVLTYLHNVVVKRYLVFARVTEQLGSTLKRTRNCWLIKATKPETSKQWCFQHVQRTDQVFLSLQWELIIQCRFSSMTKRSTEWLPGITGPW